MKPAELKPFKIGYGDEQIAFYPRMASDAELVEDAESTLDAMKRYFDTRTPESEKIVRAAYNAFINSMQPTISFYSEYVIGILKNLTGNQIENTLNALT